MPEDAVDKIQRHTLVLESPRGLETMDLARRLRELGAPMTVLPDFEAAEEVLREEDLDVGAILVPTPYEPDVVGRHLDLLCGLAPKDGLRFISVGESPDKGHRKRLRKVGVKLAMWNPLQEAHLRFQLNRAHSPAPDGFGNRESPRVPTDWGCAVSVGGRTKDAAIFSLAETGAFLATKRAVMNGARVSLQMFLPDGVMDAEADVVYANVPGNLQKPGLPLGMGVQFDGVDKRDRKRLRNLIKESVALLEV
ncbi:MAG: PilZ domain-containing protein [Myxococcota bacterium]|jgi:hypothetical protein|nr:PilZ domain-containing protein [Myxococcota bacterium]